MTLDILNGLPFVRYGNVTRPLQAVLIDLAGQAAELDDAAELAQQAHALAHDALVSALVTGNDVDAAREHLTRTEANLADIAEQRRELDAQAADLHSQHSTALAKRLTADVSAQLAALARPLDAELKRIAAL